MTNKQIFPDSFPYVSSNLELDNLKTRWAQYEDAYIATGSIKERKEWIEKLWGIYEPYADSNFHIDIKQKGKFNERTWEMYLGATVLSRKLVLNKKTAVGPDINLVMGNQNVWIEATAPGIGEVDAAPERPTLLPGVLYSGSGDIEENNRPLLLRIRAAVENKKSEYKKNLEKQIIKDKDPYIIAINGYGFLGLVADTEYLVRRTFFAAGCYVYSKFSTGNFSGPSFKYEPIVNKIRPDGSIEKIATDIFTDKTHEEISGVLFSPDHICSSIKDWKTIGNNLMLVRNSFARNPIPLEFPLLGGECSMEGNAITYRYAE